MELTVKDVTKIYGSKKAALSHVSMTFTPRNLRASRTKRRGKKHAYEHHHG